MSNIMTFLVYESVDWEFDNVIAVASTYERAVELLVERLNDSVNRPDRVDSMRGRVDSTYHNIDIDTYRIVQTVIDGLRSNTRETKVLWSNNLEIPLFLDNERVIQHSHTTEFQKNGGYFTVDAVLSMLETYEQWKYGVVA